MTQSSGTNDFWWVPVLAAVIAASAAVYTTVTSSRAQRKGRSKEHLRRQLDELYGEIYILRLVSERLWERLHEKDTDFRLIDNITAIMGEQDGRRRRVVEQIIAINARIAELMTTKASLMTELPPPKSFIAFLDHQRALSTLWDMGKDVGTDGPEPSFPRDLTTDVEAAVQSIQKRLKELGD